jgi:hypothetical protein
MPYADLSGLGNDRGVRAVTDLFTVDLVARYVEWKLSQAGATSSPSTPVVAAS